MNTNPLKTLTFAATLAVGLGGAMPVMATSTGVQAIGPGQGLVDVWTFNCPVAFPRGRATVQDTLLINDPLTQIGVELRQNFATSSQIDLTEGLLPSPAAVVNGLPGQYVATISKNRIFSESYQADLYCVGLFGLRVNPLLTRRINQ